MVYSTMCFELCSWPKRSRDPFGLFFPPSRVQSPGFASKWSAWNSMIFGVYAEGHQNSLWLELLMSRQIGSKPYHQCLEIQYILHTYSHGYHEFHATIARCMSCMESNSHSSQDIWGRLEWRGSGSTPPPNSARKRVLLARWFQQSTNLVELAFHTGKVHGWHFQRSACNVSGESSTHPSLWACNCSGGPKLKKAILGATKASLTSVII